MREGEQNLGSAQTQIACLKETQEKLRIELDATRARVRETSNLLTDLQVRRCVMTEGGEENKEGARKESERRDVLIAGKQEMRFNTQLRTELKASCEITTTRPSVPVFEKSSASISQT